MKNLITITRKVELNTAVSKMLAEKLGTRIERLTAESVYNYYVLGRNMKTLKRINLVHDFTNRQVLAIVKDFANDCYTITYGKNDSTNVNANESLSIYKRNNVSHKVKSIDKDNSVNYTIALIKQTQFGNNQYLLKDGSFDTSLVNRQSFKSLKGAENLINNLVKVKKVSPYTLKVVSSEVN